ncbi:hypothetical protein H0H87_009406 [Tephrocybe sp. NHM501043]|nr:hypothetical protein H0H87_009406 [Tephrocybe sp. NHM501043]
MVKYNTTNGNAPGKLNSIADLDDWISAVQHLDEGVCAKKDRDHHALQAHIAASKKQFKLKLTSTNTTTNFKQKYAYKLDNNEKVLLNANDGCCSCRELFIGAVHICKFKMTLLPFDKVVKITPEYVKECKEKYNKGLGSSNTPSKSSSTTTNVAAVFHDESEEEEYLMDVQEEPKDLYGDEYILPPYIFWNSLISSDFQ